MVGNLGSHPSVIRFMKVIYELNKPQPKYTLIWDVSKFLDYLKTLTPAEKLSLKELPLKTVMLTLLATCQQGQLISLLSLNGIQMLPHIAYLSLDEDTDKQTKQNNSTCNKN